MISRVVIKNFKSIGEAGVDLELKPLTLLVGPNGGGKSSILEAIAVASQNNYDGRLTKFPSWESIVHKTSGTLNIEVFFDWSDSSSPPFFRRRFETAGTGNDGGLVGHQTETTRKRLREFQSDTYLLTSVRGNVPYSVSTEGSHQWVGANGEFLLLSLNVVLGQNRFGGIADKITEWASRFGIDGLKAGLRGDGRAGSDYLDSDLRVPLELALAQAGSKQILTVITQLFWAPEGSLLMIEEPEISLHPKAQIDVLEMFAEAINDGGKQIIATTHSIIMLQALGYAVLKGWLTPDQIAVYHVEKGEEGTTAQQLPLDENGYIRDWVPSFTEVERHLMREWAKTVPRE